MCLNVEALDAAGNAIELRDTEDEPAKASQELGIDLTQVVQQQLWMKFNNPYMEIRAKTYGL